MLTKQQIEEYRKKYNLGTLPTHNAVGTSSADEKIRMLREGTFGGESPISAPTVQTTSQLSGNKKLQSQLESTQQKNKVSEFFKGALKGVGSSVRGALKLTEKGMQTVTRQNVGEPTAVEEIIPEDLVTPQVTAQKVGFGVEQIAEFFLPGGAITKTTKLVKGGKLAQLGVRSALEAGTVAGQTAIQEGELNKNVLVAGGLAGLFPVATKVLAAPFKNLAKSSWAGILKRTPTEVAKNPNLESQILKEGVVAGSQKGLQQKAGQVIQQIEVQLDDLLQGSQGKVQTSAVIDHLNALKETYSKIPGEKNALRVIDEIGEDILAKGENIGVLEANQLKRDIYGLISKTYGKGFMDIPVKQEAQKLVARALKEEIEKIAPEVKNLNQRQAIYLQIKKAIDKRMARESGKGAVPFVGNIGLFDILSAVGGAGLGYSQGGSGDALKYGLGAAALRKGFSSTAFLSATAKIVDHFNSLSPTKKIMFMKGLEGLTSQGIQQKEKKKD